MRCEDITAGTFISCPNRFIAYCEIDGRKEKCQSRTPRFAVNYFTEEEIRSYLTEFEILDVKRFTEGPKNLFGIFLRKK